VYYVYDFIIINNNNNKQSFWDKLGLQNDRALIENSFVEPSQKVRFLVSVASYTGDWLLALPTASCSFRLDDEAVRVAVGMRLGLALCVPHSCPRGDRWTPKVSIRWCAKRRQVELPDTRSGMTPSGDLWALPAFQPPRSLQDWSGKTVNGLTGSP